MPTYDEYMKMLNDEPDFSQPTIGKIHNTPLTQMTGSEIAGAVVKAATSPLRTVQDAGGYALTKTLAGVSSIGQGITGFFRALEDDKAMYDQLFGQQSDGTYDNRAGKFHWEKLGEFFGSAGREGVAQARRVAASDNLTELGQNSTSYTDVLKHLPGVLGDAFNVDDTRTKIGTATLGFMLDVMLDPAGMAGKVGAAEKVLANGQRVTTGGKLFGSTIIGSTGVRNQLAKRGIEEMGLYATGGGIAKGITKAMGANDAVQDVARRVGGNLALGNPFGALAVVPARTLVDKSLTVARRMAQDSGHRYYKQANSLLDWVVGPTASASEQAATTFVKGIALSEELPRLINSAAEAQQTLLTRVKGNGNKRAASMLFNDLVIADAGARQPILQKLEKLGINSDDAQSVADHYQRGIINTMDVLKDSGNADLIERVGINPQHIPLMYRINMGGKIQADQLTYLQQINTPASWELRQGGNLRQRLTTLMTGGAPNSPEFFNLVSGTNFTLADRAKLPGVRPKALGTATAAQAFPDRMNDAASMTVKNSGGVERAISTKLVPLSLLANDGVKVSEKKLAEFGIKASANADSKLRPSPLINSNASPLLSGSGVQSSKFGISALEPAVGKLDATANAGVRAFDEPARLPKGFSRVHVRNQDDVEQAKAALMQVRKELISGVDFADDATAVRSSLDNIQQTTGNSIAVDSRGYLYSVNAKGEKVGLFVRSSGSNGGVTLVNPHAYEGMADSFMDADPQKNIFNGFLRDGGMVNEEAILEQGQTAREVMADNSVALSDFGRPVVTKTAFEVPAIPGMNTLDVRLPSTFPKNYSKEDTARRGLQQKVAVNGAKANPFVDSGQEVPVSTARKDFSAKGFQNQAVKPNGNPARGGFEKTALPGSMPQSARILSDTDMEDFFGALGEYMDGLRDKGNNVLGRYHELTNGGKITKIEDGQEVTRTVNAQEYWEHLRENTREKTVTDLLEFAHNWGASKNIPKELRSVIGQHLGEALTYVPGSREFSMGVKALRNGDGALDELQKYFGDAWTEVSGRSGQAFETRKLDPVYHNLYGKVDDFAVRAMGEADKLSETTARTVMVSEMKRAGIMTENPFPGAINMRERIGPEEAKLLGIEGDLKKDWWISPGNLAAYQNAFNAIKLGGPVERVLQPFANQFRRAALTTDISAHVTQMLGNLAMMTHMGYGPLFEDPRKLVSGYKRTFSSILLMDDHYQDMVKSGLQITMSPLSEGQRQILAERNLLRADSRAETFRDVAEQMHSTWAALLHKGKEKYTTTVEGVEDKVTQALNGKMDDYVQARQLQQAVKPGAMFAMHDMTTRAYVWDQVYRHETQQLVEANPWLAHFLGDNGLVSEKALGLNDEATFTEVLKNLGGERLVREVSYDDAKMMVGELQAARNKAAQIGNEVALNYFEVPRALRLLTQTGVVPFMKFQWKAMGRFMEWMDERPFQFAPYYKASTNANAAFSDKPEDWIQTQQALPQNVRNAMVIPLGTKDQIGRDEFIDISRWVPFGMFAGSGGGAVSPDGSPLPNQLITAPLVDLIMSAKSGQDADGNPFFPEGQSKLGAIAEKLALMFSPSGVGPGGRRAQQLANAMEQSKFVVDDEGKPMFNNPVMNVGAQWGRLPQNLATEVGQMFGDNGNATALRKTPDVNTPWTTPTQAMTRSVLPGYAYSADAPKAYGQIEKAFDGKLNDLKKRQSTIVNSMTYQLEPDKFTQQLNDIGVQMQKLEEQKSLQLSRLTLGE